MVLEQEVLIRNKHFFVKHKKEYHFYEMFETLLDFSDETVVGKRQTDKVTSRLNVMSKSLSQLNYKRSRISFDLKSHFV